MSKTRYSKSAWAGKGVEVEKPWGTVISWTALKTVGGKIIKIKKGERTSLKYNTLKDEALFLISGSIIASQWTPRKPPEQSTELRIPLKPGDTFNIQSEVPFRLTALEDSYLVEISNEKNNNIVRLADDYGRNNEKS